MTTSQAERSSQALWYVLWSAMLLVSAGNTLCYSPIFSGTRGLAFSGLLAATAGVQVLRGSGFLRRRETVLCGVMLIVFCLAQMVQFALAKGPPLVKRGVDFSAYYLAGKVISEKPAESIYQLPLFADGRLNLDTEVPDSSPWHAAAVRYHVPLDAPYIYPPFFAVLMRPLAHLSFAAAYLAWTLITVASVGCAVLLSLILGGVRIDRKLMLIVGVGVLCYYPFFENLYFGQISGVILLLFAAGVWLLSKNHAVLSALCFAVATAIKLTPALVVPVLIFHRRWKWLTAYAAWMAGLLVFSVGQAGWSMHLQFLHLALPSMSCGSPVCQNTSIVAYVQEIFLGHVPVSRNPPLTIPPYACAVSRWVAVAVYSLMLFRCYLRRREGLVERDIVVMILLAIAISPISWVHHYTLALLPFLYFWSTMRDKGNIILLALFLAVSTNVIGLIALSAVNHAEQLVLAAIVPGLTIALAYLKLAPGQEPAGRIEA
jgi:Glycosyltransferase family 87